MNWRTSITDIKREFGALGAGIEEIAVAARKEVWERMRGKCMGYHLTSSNILCKLDYTLCAFDTCPLLKSAGGEEET
jgi:hypothetical protein